MAHDRNNILSGVVSYPDLMLLDMIMPPGMDGLETYRSILEIVPCQRAIIASGYAETANVREAQRLGAGGYVRKPYTLECIGMAVRSELDRLADADTPPSCRR